LPSPFNNPETPVEPERSTGVVVEQVPVVNSELTCEFCFGMSTEGTYVPQAKRLTWLCDECGKENVVRNIEI
jgi:hypothetical protein